MKPAMTLPALRRCDEPPGGQAPGADDARGGGDEPSGRHRHRRLRLSELRLDRVPTARRRRVLARRQRHDLVDEVEALRAVRDQEDGAVAGRVEDVVRRAPPPCPGRGAPSARRGGAPARRRGAPARRTSRCRWPPESRPPSSPTSVSSPSGSDATQSASRARRSASTSSSSVASGRPSLRFSRMRRGEDVRVLAGERERAPNVLLA